MKTHDLAKALTHLARVLRAGPNIEFDELINFSTYLTTERKLTPVRNRGEKGTSERGAGIALLAQMASYEKSDLLLLARELEIPIEVRRADAVRDVLGKILKYINENPDIKDRLSYAAERSDFGEASTLAKALSILMNQGR